MAVFALSFRKKFQVMWCSRQNKMFLHNEIDNWKWREKVWKQNLSYNRSCHMTFRFVYDRGISAYIAKLLSLPFEQFLKKHRLLSLFRIWRFHRTPIYLKLLVDRGTSLWSSLIRISELLSSKSQRCPIRVSIIEWNKLEASHRYCVEINRFRTLILTYVSLETGLMVLRSVRWDGRCFDLRNIVSIYPVRF